MSYRYVTICVQLALVLLGLALFQIEVAQGLLALSPVIGVGFAIHALLPKPRRRACFFGLSIVGLVAVVGPADAALITVVGVGLVALCHLPLGYGVRVGLVATAACLLAAVRVEWIALPRLAGVLPVLGSMFMFRLILYLYDLRHEPDAGSWWSRLSYFFLLPNACFLLFPIVDSRTARRTWYDDEDEVAGYRRGLFRMVRGGFHLLLYRAVAFYWMPARAEVDDLGSLALFLVLGYAQILRISGQFHIAVGILGLFGYNLPRPCNFYYLSSSFADYWRRANIYWRDFMVKLFFYPSFLRLRRRGLGNPVFAATILVFLCTWLLHGWQWFWLLGRFRLSSMDSIFWAIFGLAVAVNAVLESRHPPTPRTTARGRIARGLRVLGTFSAICVLWSLWNSSSVPGWFDLLRRGASTTAGQMAGLLAVGAGLLALGLFVERLRGTAAGRGLRRHWARHRTVVACVALPLLGLPAFQSVLPSSASDVLYSLTRSELTAAQGEAMVAGYYGDLEQARRLSGEHWMYQVRRWGWSKFDPVIDAPEGPFLWIIRPSSEGVHLGKSLRSNRWGMRDRDYTLDRPPGTFRLALAGPSDAMGEGVEQEEVFEVLVEDALNAGDDRRDYEILNFSRPALRPLHVQRLLPDIERFDPQVLLLVLHEGDQRASDHLMSLWLQRGVELPEGLRRLIEPAGVRADMSVEEMRRRLRPHAEAMLEWTFSETAAWARDRGVVPAVLLMKRIGQVSNASDVQRLTAMAADRGFVILDISAAYDGDDEREFQVSAIDHHPNAEGHRRLAAALLAELQAHQAVLGLELREEPRP